MLKNYLNSPSRQSFLRKIAAGFTLVEVMVVVAITGILLAIAMPSFGNLVGDTEVSTTVNEFVSAVSLARSEAVKRGKLVTVCRSSNPEASDATCAVGDRDWASGWLVYVESGFAATGARDAGEVILLRKGALRSGMAIKHTPSGGEFISFNSTGEPAGMSNAGFNFSKGDKFLRQACIARTGRLRVIKDADKCS